MMRNLFVVFGILLVSIVSLAQTPAASAAAVNDAPTREQVLRMLDAMQTTKTVHGAMESVQKQIGEMMDQQTKKMVPDAPPEMRAEMSAAMQDMIKEMEPIMTDLMQQMVPVYQKNLTSKEVDAITAFYLSPEGQSFLNKMPEIMNDSMSAVMDTMNVKMQPITEKLAKRMEDIAKKYAPQMKDSQNVPSSPKPATRSGTSKRPSK